MTITIYTQPYCPPCKALKAQYTRDNIPFTEIEIGKDITKEQFFELFPGVRRVPHVVSVKITE